jgi:cytochrome c-type biogenesis protein CcmH
MLFWLLCATMTAAALYAVTRPLILPHGENLAQDAAADLSVYRDQLNEVEAERSRGLLGEAEAAAARTEISRRLLARAEGADSAAAAGHPDRRLRNAGRVFFGTAIIVPLMALGFYLANGAPGLPGTSHGQRSAEPVAETGIAGLIAKVEERLQAHPEDGQGWDVIAPVYLRQGRFMDAAQAFQRAIRLLGETPRRLAGLGEASVLAADGIVTEDAKRAFTRLNELEPARPEPRFWLALAKEQDGQLAEALADYRALIAAAPADADWRGAVDERVRSLSAKLDGTEQKPAPGPSAEDIAAAEKLDPAARAEMIEQMVAGLAERLKSDGNDLAGWQRLLRAYAVLGQKDKATQALAEARKALAGDQSALTALNDLARSLGFET